MKEKVGMEYKMPKGMFQSLLQARKESEKKLNPYTYVLNIVNEQYGLLREVTNIIVD